MKSELNPLMTSNSNEWYTPQKLFDEINEQHKITLDPCATQSSAKAEKYFTIEDDGLSKDWGGHNVFCNPPYGRDIKHWVKKCYEESLKEDTKVIMLIPSRTDTKYWHDYIFPYAKDIKFLKGRIKFMKENEFGELIEGDAAPFPSAIITFEKGETK